MKSKFICIRCTSSLYRRPITGKDVLHRYNVFLKKAQLCQCWVKALWNTNFYIPLLFRGYFSSFYFLIFNKTLRRKFLLYKTAPSAPVINPQMPNSATQTSLRVCWSLFSDDTVEFYELYYRPVLEDTPADSTCAAHGTNSVTLQDNTIYCRSRSKNWDF